MALNLPPFPRNVRLIDPNTGFPTVEFVRFMQARDRATEAHEAYQDSIIDLQAATVAAQDAADTANAAAATATTAASTAQSTADAIAAENNLVNSYVDGTPPILTATDAGASATITIANHTRVYGDSSTLAITGASLTGKSYSTTYFVYYVDATRVDTTPSFLTTTDGTVAAQTGDTHLVGAVTTPAAAAPDTSGDYVAPPGLGSLYDYL